jgi:hypothetical protein
VAGGRRSRSLAVAKIENLTIRGHSASKCDAQRPWNRLPDHRRVRPYDDGWRSGLPTEITRGKAPNVTADDWETTPGDGDVSLD